MYLYFQKCSKSLNLFLDLSSKIKYFLIAATAAPNGPAWFHIKVVQLSYSAVSSRSFYQSINLYIMPTGYWFGFKNLENITLIYKPDRMKNETFIVHFIFNFCNFNFTWVEVGLQFLVIKVSRNLSKFSKTENEEHDALCLLAEVYRRPKIFGRSQSFLTFSYSFGHRRFRGPKTEDFVKSALFSKELISMHFG